jgi:hypothetical protein
MAIGVIDRESERQEIELTDWTYGKRKVEIKLISPDTKDLILRQVS